MERKDAIRGCGGRCAKPIGRTLLNLFFIFFAITATFAENLKEVKIAALYPMTGVTASSGITVMRGWNIAVDEINAAGGIKSLGGAKLKTVLYDTEGDPRVGMTQIEKIAQDLSIPVVGGCWASAVTYPVTQISEQYGLPHIIEVASQYDIMQRGFKYIFRICLNAPGTAQNWVNFFKYQAKKTGVPITKVAMMTVDDNYGRDTVAMFKKAIAGTDLKLVAEVYHPTTATNVDVEVAKVKAANPDVIIVTAFLNDGSLITRSLYTQGVNPTGGIMFNGGHSIPDFLKLTGKMSEYFCGGFKWDAGLIKPELANFDAQMMERYNVHADPMVASGYAEVYVIKDALERAGTINRDKVRDALASTYITSGPALALACKYIKFNAIGENEGATEHICQNINGRWTNVWPVDMPHEREAIWPWPGFKK